LWSQPLGSEIDPNNCELNLSHASCCINGWASGESSNAFVHEYCPGISGRKILHPLEVKVCAIVRQIKLPEKVKVST
jgi:hypothetical protein